MAQRKNYARTALFRCNMQASCFLPRFEPSGGRNEESMDVALAEYLLGLLGGGMDTTAFVAIAGSWHDGCPRKARRYSVHSEAHSVHREI